MKKKEGGGGGGWRTRVTIQYIETYKESCRLHPTQRRGPRHRPVIP
jgi:hypothetical protein